MVKFLFLYVSFGTGKMMNSRPPTPGHRYIYMATAEAQHIFVHRLVTFDCLLSEICHLVAQ